MSEEEREPSSDVEVVDEQELEEEEEEEYQSTPFDHPFFLPVLLTGFALWFGYDGWFNEDMEWVKFNRYGFGILAVAATYYTVRAIREYREMQQQAWTCTACNRENPSWKSSCQECGAAAPAA